MGEGDTDVELLREALKRVAVTLKEADVPFALAGGYASYARGGPETDHDVDFVVRHDSIDQALAVLQREGLAIEDPPEDWLVKAWLRKDGRGAMVDLMHTIANEPVDEEMIGRAEPIEVLSVMMPVLSATDIVASKMRALSEHYCDFSQLLIVVRALREQVDWPRLRAQTESNDFAAAFLFLLERLGIAS
jgi:hypothetical protein